jgi:PAS domain S-box-containing protein
MTAGLMPIAVDSLCDEPTDLLRDSADDLAFALPEVLWDLVPTAVYACDVNGTIVRFNRRAAQLWGREPKLLNPNERYCGAHRLYRLDGSLLPHPECPMADVLLTGEMVRDQEVVIERPDGSRILALVNIEPLRDGEGAIIGAINCFQDITDRKRAEAALQESERHTRALLDALPAAVYTTNGEGRITYFNETAAALWGYRPTLNRDMWCGSVKLYRPDGTWLPHDECPMAVTLKEDRPVRGVEAIAERPDGTRIPFLPLPMPLHDEFGNLVGAVNMLFDLRERKASEDIAQRFAAIVQSTDDAILSVDLDRIITSWNGAAERLYGYRAEEVVGHSMTFLIPADRLHEENTIIDRIRRGERVDHYETVRKRKDGSLVDVSLTASPLKDSKGRIIGASKIARDITERKRAEAQIATLAREAEHRSKNILATVQATVHLTQADTVDAFKKALSGRIQALANAHVLFAQSRWTGADLRALAMQELSPYCQGDQSRARFEGSAILLEPGTAQIVGVCLHELATNAAKYGALSRPHGRVRIAWSRTSVGRVVLTWSETGGPPVSRPRRQGFGTRVMKNMIEGQLKGEMRMDWRPEGLACKLTFAM